MAATKEANEVVGVAARKVLGVLDDDVALAAADAVAVVDEALQADALRYGGRLAADLAQEGLPEGAEAARRFQLRSGDG